jgi:hypothetical protein
MKWGSRVLQSAREEMDPTAAADPKSLPTIWQIARAEGRVYDGIVNDSSGDYQLDYPPIRLLTM